jgi:putative ABC transport system permease protein
LKNLAVRVQTTAFALAALAIAVSMLIGITLLIGSFRETLRTWLDTSIRADLYVTTESWARGRQEAYLTPEVLAGLTGHPAVMASESLRQTRVYTGERRIRFGGLSLDLQVRKGLFPLLAGEPDEVFRRLQDEDAAVVSEPLARKEGLEIGDTLRVRGPAGELRFPIAGITYDYSSEGGAALVHLNTFEKAFGPGPINNVSLYLADTADAELVGDELRAGHPGVPLLIRSNQRLRTEIMQIFDQTFAITRILQVMALLIAVSGVSLTLIILARQRVAELALYRALGAWRRQIFRIFLGEGLGLGVLGLVLGCLGGVGLAVILIFIINRDYFGWSIRPSWPWLEIGQEMVTILVAAVVASLYPALRASRVPAQELSREDL